MNKLFTIIFLCSLIITCNVDKGETKLRGKIVTLCDENPYKNKLIKVITGTSNGFINPTRSNLLESDFYTDDLGSFDHTFDPITNTSNINLYTIEGDLIASSSYQSNTNFSIIYQLDEFEIEILAAPTEKYSLQDTLIVSNLLDSSFILNSDTIYGPFDSTLNLNFPFILPRNIYEVKEHKFTNTKNFKLNYSWELKRSSAVNLKSGSITVDILNCEAFNNSFNF